MKPKIKSYAIQFIKEIIPVIAGILIALFIDNWNSQRKDKAYIQQVFSTIDSELKESKEEVANKIPKQQALIDSLNRYADNENISFQDIIIKSDGVHIPQIRINAWKSIANTKIDLIDYRKITLLSNIEELKETLNNKSDFLMNFMYSNFNTTDKNVKATAKLILMDIIQTERTIQETIAYFEEGNMQK
ncbi:MULTISPECIES: hypothetical protein [Sphingobacterium]|uniref:hypothetical protein n=1 Tax=Sphingobacterium TaxID=28453 RepID=UPI0013DBB28D|nr:MULTISPECIES: hypothetical protein [unclassified Sphingobacterium]